jgi:hypothetical protein
MSELSVQLYTLRKDLEQDFGGTLVRLAGVGFTQVEPFQLVKFADVLRTGLRQSGLTAPTTHVGLLSGNQDEICARSRARHPDNHRPVRRPRPLANGG